MAQGSTVSFVFPIGKLNSEQRTMFELAIIKRREINPETFEIDFDAKTGEHTVTAYPNPSLWLNSLTGVSPDVRSHEMIQKLISEVLMAVLGLRVSNR